MDINFELYKIFYHAASNGSFSKAAAKLYISQSAVSQAIKNLETKLGVSLFSRHTRYLKLTNEGELLLTHIEQAFNFIKVAEAKIGQIQNLEAGEIRIGASDTVCKYFLLPYLDRFHQKYPKVKVQFINRTSPRIIESLTSGTIDFGIVTLPVNDENLNVNVLSTINDIFVASEKFSFLRGKRVSWDELTRYPILLLEKNSTTRRNLDRFFVVKNIHLVPEIELESVDLLVEFAKIGLGVAHVLKESASEEINNGLLFVVETIEQLPPRDLGVITSRSVPLSQACRIFLNQFISE